MDDDLIDTMDDIDACLSQALGDLGLAHTLALDAKELTLAQQIHESMRTIEAVLGFVPAPTPTHNAPAVLQ